MKGPFDFLQQVQGISLDVCKIQCLMIISNAVSVALTPSGTATIVDTEVKSSDIFLGKNWRDPHQLNASLNMTSVVEDKMTVTVLTFYSCKTLPWTTKPLAVLWHW